MSRIKLLKCKKCFGEAEAVCDALWIIHCVECGEESRAWVYLNEASKEWNHKNSLTTPQGNR